MKKKTESDSEKKRNKSKMLKSAETMDSNIFMAMQDKFKTLYTKDYTGDEEVKELIKSQLQGDANS